MRDRSSRPSRPSRRQQWPLPIATGTAVIGVLATGWGAMWGVGAFALVGVTLSFLSGTTAMLLVVAQLDASGL
jgi:hypothetical protein